MLRLQHVVVCDILKHRDRVKVSSDRNILFVLNFLEFTQFLNYYYFFYLNLCLCLTRVYVSYLHINSCYTSTIKIIR